MLQLLHNNRPAQLVLGFIMGIAFGFFLQRSGVTRFDAIVGQLLLTDFTVMKVILMAIAVGMAGVWPLRAAGLATIHIKPGSIGGTLVGGLIFGVGMAILGYCPGTAAGAAGQGSLDALTGDVTGMLAGTAIYARIYPRLRERALGFGDFGKLTFPELFGSTPGATVMGFLVSICAMMAALEILGL